jgi:hypothetical protein
LQFSLQTAGLETFGYILVDERQGAKSQRMHLENSVVRFGVDFPLFFMQMFYNSILSVAGSSDSSGSHSSGVQFESRPRTDYCDGGDI